jgi:hypothetical protein
MGECQLCRAAVIVPRPLQLEDGTWILACNRCYHGQKSQLSPIYHEVTE